MLNVQLSEDYLSALKTIVEIANLNLIPKDLLLDFTEKYFRKLEGIN